MVKRLFFITLPVLFLFIIVALQDKQARAEPAGKTLLRASDGVAGDMFGYALDFDGATIVAGAIKATVDDTQQRGAVYVFTQDEGGHWVESAKLTDNAGEEYDWFGAAVAVDGDVIAVGVPFKDGGGFTQRGIVHIYERDPADPNNWLLVAARSDSTLDAFANFGDDVALDGDRLIVGAPGADVYGVSRAGAAYIYERDQGGAGNWGQIIRLRDAEGHISDGFGSAVDIRGDTAVVGARNADVMAVPDNEGAAFVFDRDFAGPGTWAQVQRLTPSHFADNAKFGDAVAIDGTTIVVGAWGYSVIPANSPPEYSFGKAFVYEEAYIGANNWVHAATLGASDRADFDFFGTDVAISGATAVIGAPNVDDGVLDDQGAIYRYVRDSGGPDNWGEIDKIPPTEGTKEDYFGYALAIEGSTIVVGSFGSDAGQGVVYVIDDSSTPAPKRTTAYLPLIVNRARNPIIPNGVLEDGSVFEDSSGAIIGVITGTLTKPLDVLLATIDEPASPYADGADPVGPYYRIGVAESVYTPVDKPFLIGLPVPSGANPADLAVAILEPAESILDWSGGGEVWHVARGAYDPATNLFSFTFSNLNPSGVTVVLIEHPDNELLLSFDRPVGSELPNTSGMRAMGQIGETPIFSVSCGSRDSHAVCTPDIMNDVEVELLRAYDDFTGLGFREPALNRHVAQFFMGPLRPSLILYTEFYDVKVYDVNSQSGPCTEYNGMFYPSTQNIAICVEVALGINDFTIQIIRHELFHAVQYAYQELRNAADMGQKWLKEGTATAAMRSNETMLRSPYWDLRQIRPSLLSQSKLEEYEAQDFWVYAGDSLGVSLDYLIPIFENGAEPAEVDQVLSLGSAYWRYVKNQVAEKEVNFEGHLPGLPCTMTSSLMGNTGGDNQIDYPASTTALGMLEPLSAVVLEITFKQDYPWVRITASGAEILEYKVYESGESDCANVPDGERGFSNVAANDKRYVVLANIDYLVPLNYMVTITSE